MSAPAIRSVVEQHADEAGFLWFLRDLAVSNPDYSLAEITELDHRLEAHIDGLRIAGDVGIGTTMQALEEGEGGQVFAASVLALEAYGGHQVDWIVDVASRSDESWRGLVSALGWVPLGCASTWFDWMTRGNSAHYQRLGISGHAICRVDPGPALALLIHADDVGTRARSLQAVGELKRADLLDGLLEHLKDEDLASRYSAGWSAALLGSAHGIEAMVRFAETPGIYQRAALDLSARLLAPDGLRQLLARLAAQPGNARLAMVGAGASGDPRFIPGLLRRMSDDKLARAAGEAFTAITGLDIEAENLAREAPPDIDAGPNDDAQNDEVAMDEDEDLPWPDAEGVAQWWRSHEAAFAQGKRYLAGAPLTADTCKRVLRHGKQRQRIAAAVELALLQPDELLFETRAPGSVQLRQLQ